MKWLMLFFTERFLIALYLLWSNRNKHIMPPLTVLLIVSCCGFSGVVEQGSVRIQVEWNHFSQLCKASGSLQLVSALSCPYWSLGFRFFIFFRDYLYPWTGLQFSGCPRVLCNTICLEMSDWMRDSWRIVLDKIHGYNVVAGFSCGRSLANNALTGPLPDWKSLPNLQIL